MDRAEIKKKLHCARVNLTYRKKTATPEVIAATQAEVDHLAELYSDSDPAKHTMRVRSPYFIGPKRRRGRRTDGPTIRCFHCGCDKPREEYYEKGARCKKCVIARSANWVENNREKASANKMAWQKEKRKNDPAFRAFSNCRCRLGNIMKGIGGKRGHHFSELTGTTAEGLRTHLESLFEDGMSWDNYGWGPGKWVVDHVIPARSFDHLIDEEIKKCWVYTNLQPMRWKENMDKSDFLPCGTRARHKRKSLTNHLAERLVVS